MKQADFHWLVGLLEGEGSFGLCRNHVQGHTYIYHTIQLGMNDRDVVQRAANLMDAWCKGWPRPAPRRKRWHTSLTNSRATALMKKLYPFMSKRRKRQIHKALKAKLGRIP